MALSLLPLSQLDALYLLHSVATLLLLICHSHATLLGLRSYTTLMYFLSLRQYKYLSMVITEIPILCLHPELIRAPETLSSPSLSPSSRSPLHS